MSKLKKGCLVAAIVIIALGGVGWWYVWSLMHPPKLANLAPADVISYQSIDPLNLIGLQVGPVTIWRGVSQRYQRTLGAQRVKNITQKLNEFMGVKPGEKGDTFWTDQIKSWFSREFAKATRIEITEGGWGRSQYLMLLGSRSRGKADRAIAVIFERKAQDIYNIVKFGIMTGQSGYLDAWTDNPKLVTEAYKGVKIYCPMPKDPNGGNVPCLAAVKGALAIAFVPDLHFGPGAKPQGMKYAQDYLKLIIDNSKSGGKGTLAGTELYKSSQSKIPSGYIIYAMLNFEAAAKHAKELNEMAAKNPESSGWVTPYGPKLMENLSMFKGVLVTFGFDNLSPKLKISLVLNKPAGGGNRFADLAPSDHQIAKLLNTPESLVFVSAASVDKLGGIFNDVMTDPQYVGEESVANYKELKQTLKQGYGLDVDLALKVLDGEAGATLIGIQAADPKSDVLVPVPHFVGAIKIKDQKGAEELIKGVADSLQIGITPDGKINRISIDPGDKSPATAGFSPAFAFREGMLVVATVAEDLEKFLTGENGKLTGLKTNAQGQVHMDPVLQTALGWVKELDPEAGKTVSEFEPLTREAFKSFSDVRGTLTLRNDELTAEFDVVVSDKVVKEYDWEKLVDKIIEHLKKPVQK